jgi:hypothetical protein
MEEERGRAAAAEGFEAGGPGPGSIFEASPLGTGSSPNVQPGENYRLGSAEVAQCMEVIDIADKEDEGRMPEERFADPYSGIQFLPQPIPAYIRPELTREGLRNDIIEAFGDGYDEKIRDIEEWLFCVSEYSQKSQCSAAESSSVSEYSQKSQCSAAESSSVSECSQKSQCSAAESSSVSEYSQKSQCSAAESSSVSEYTQKSQCSAAESSSVSEYTQKSQCSAAESSSVSEYSQKSQCSAAESSSVSEYSQKSQCSAAESSSVSEYSQKSQCSAAESSSVSEYTQKSQCSAAESSSVSEYTQKSQCSAAESSSVSEYSQKSQCKSSCVSAAKKQRFPAGEYKSSSDTGNIPHQPEENSEDLIESADDDFLCRTKRQRKWRSEEEFLKTSAPKRSYNLRNWRKKVKLEMASKSSTCTGRKCNRPI